jgi:hypothetical protein
VPVNTRRPLSLSFYDEKTAQRFKAAGVELIWIGVGTLSTPEDVTQEWINAWHSDIIARIKSSKTNLEELKRNARVKVFERLLNDVGDWWLRASSPFHYAPSKKQTAGAGSAGRGEAPFGDERASGYYVFSQEDERRAMDMLNLYVVKLTEFRQSLDPKLLPPKTDEAIAYIKKLAGPQIIGDDGDTP